MAVMPTPATSQTVVSKITAVRIKSFFMAISRNSELALFDVSYPLMWWCLARSG